ncbi:MAG: TIM barrel protein [Terrimicrobiaceae bacterium]|nr:TIM barrel protein [Terrimicrobiaceae bacterium]
MRYTLQEAALVAEPRGIRIGLEPHQQYSKHPDGLEKIYRLVSSPAIGFNFDTGNSYLSGSSAWWTGWCICTRRTFPPASRIPSGAR